MRTLTLKGKNGYGHDECVMANVEQLGFDDSRKRGDLSDDLFVRQIIGCISPDRRKHQPGKDCVELAWQSGSAYAVSLSIR